MTPDPDIARQYARARDELEQIYRRLTDERLFDPEQPDRAPDEPATTMLPAVALDPQSVAYRGMGPNDIVSDAEVRRHAARSHEPLDPARPPAEQLLLPADYERQQWDADRIDPRPAP